jgi:5'-nucleotidase
MLPGAEVRVISTAEAYSGKGHVVSPSFCCRETELPGLGRVTVVDGTPADCVRAALAMPDEPRPDFVLSGINYGSNLGIDVYYSGTVAAAREAAILGIPAVAISKLVKEGFPADWDSLARMAATVACALIQPGVPPPAGLDEKLHASVARSAPAHSAQAPGFWNVNFPCLKTGQSSRGVEFTMLSTDGYHIHYVQSHDEHGRLCLTNRGNYHERPATPGTDVAAAFGGYIAITRVTL